MTYAKAKLIVWSHAAYSRADVLSACEYIIGTLDASCEDIAQATYCLYNPNK